MLQEVDTSWGVL